MEIKAITESIIMKRKRYGDRMEKDRGMDESEHLTSTNLLQGRETEIEREEWKKKKKTLFSKPLIFEAGMLTYQHIPCGGL